MFLTVHILPGVCIYDNCQTSNYILQTIKSSSLSTTAKQEVIDVCMYKCQSSYLIIHALKAKFTDVCMYNCHHIYSKLTEHIVLDVCMYNSQTKLLCATL